MTLTTCDCNKQQIELSMQYVSEEKLHRPCKSSQHCGNQKAISDGCGAGTTVDTVKVQVLQVDMMVGWITG